MDSSCQNHFIARRIRRYKERWFWLHANYFRPQIDAAEKDRYEFHLHIVHEKLSPANRLNLEQVLKFTAIQAFLLGFRTSEGLTPRTPRRQVPLLVPVKRNVRNAD